MTPFTRFLAFEALGWALVAAVLVWAVQAELFSQLVAWVLFAIWVVKDLVLYPLTKRAYEHGTTHGGGDLIGSVVLVEADVAPVGYVRWGSERWRAELAPGCETPLEVGVHARVVELRGITLLVEAAGHAADVAGGATGD